MTFHQLWTRGAFTGDVTEAQVLAADRQLRGSKLGPGARKSLRKFQRKLRNEQIVRQRENWDEHDKYLRDGTRTAGSPSRGKTETAGMTPRSARPGLGSSSSTRPHQPGATGHVEPVAPGGALKRSSFDGRTSSPADYVRRIQQLGYDPSFYQIDNCTETARVATPAPGLGVRIKEQIAASEAEKRRAQHAKEVAAGAIDGRTADPEAVRRRLDQLGIEHDIQNSIREKPKPLEPLDRAPDPFQVAAAARAKAEATAKRLAAASKRGKLVNGKVMDGPTFQAYLKERYGHWAGF